MDNLEINERKATNLKAPSIRWVLIAIAVYFVLGSLIG